jgi:hypothetical protein
MLDQSYMATAPSLIASIPMSSSALLSGSSIGISRLSAMAASAVKTPSYLKEGWTSLEAVFKIDLSPLGDLAGTEALSAPVGMVSSAAYTGLVLIATGTVPVRGRNTASTVEACLFPKIWDSDMNLLYRGPVWYFSQESVLSERPGGLSPDLEARVGSNPLRIFATEAFGIQVTDLLLDNQDAAILRGNAINRQFLEEGRVAIILDAASLNTVLEPAD